MKTKFISMLVLTLLVFLSCALGKSLEDNKYNSEDVQHALKVRDHIEDAIDILDIIDDIDAELDILSVLENSNVGSWPSRHAEKTKVKTQEHSKKLATKLGDIKVGLQGLFAGNDVDRNQALSFIDEINQISSAISNSVSVNDVGVSDSRSGVDGLGNSKGDDLIGSVGVSGGGIGDAIGSSTQNVSKTMSEKVRNLLERIKTLVEPITESKIDDSKTLDTDNSQSKLDIEKNGVTNLTKSDYLNSFHKFGNRKYGTDSTSLEKAKKRKETRDKINKYLLFREKAFSIKQNLTRSVNDSRELNLLLSNNSNSTSNVSDSSKTKNKLTTAEVKKIVFLATQIRNAQYTELSKGILEGTITESNIKEKYSKDDKYHFGYYFDLYKDTQSSPYLKLRASIGVLLSKLVSEVGGKTTVIADLTDIAKIERAKEYATKVVKVLSDIEDGKISEEMLKSIQDIKVNKDLDSKYKDILKCIGINFDQQALKK